MAEVVSLAERLKRRREELGLSQAQAARELDVARTAYRLWELEAAKPQPDRWRLISRWLGVSVTTMLLTDEADDAEDDSVTAAFARVGREWSDELSDPHEYFTRFRTLVQEGGEKGFVSASHAEELLELVAEIEAQRLGPDTVAWEPTRLHKRFLADTSAPRKAREAVVFAAGDLSQEQLFAARLLTSELVTNSVVHGPEASPIGIDVDVDRERIRVEVADRAAGVPERVPPGEAGGYGLNFVDRLASRWATEREAGGNRTWFEIDLAEPGAKPERH